jgi:hypothetical protein
MVRPLDIATQAAIRDRRAVIPRNFVLVGPVVPNAGGDAVLFGFTDFGEDIVLNIVDGWTGETVSRTFVGDNAPITAIDQMPLKIGVEIDTVQVTLNKLHPAVNAMVRGHRCRHARVQILRGWLSADSMLPVAPPRIRRLGKLNGDPITTPAIGGAGRVVLKVVSQSRETTRTNPVKASHEFYQRRGGDQWGRYAGTAGQWPIFWGEEKDTAG